MFEKWSQRRLESRLKREISGFMARLPSFYNGVGFTAKIDGEVQSEVGTIDDIVTLSAAIRNALRGAAKDVSIQCDPADLGEAEDCCRVHLRKPRRLADGSGIEFNGSIQLFLLDRDKRALDDVMNAQREQDVKEVPVLGLRDMLADRATFLCWWFNENSDKTENLPKPEQINKIADTIAAYKEVSNKPLEADLLELARSFVKSFPEKHQKRMLLMFMASGFERAERPALAEEARLLLFSNDGIDEETE